MGSDQSKTHAPVEAPSNYLCLIFKIPDKIQVVNSTEEEQETIYRSITRKWEQGVQGVRRLCNRTVVSFKCKGLPFETGIVSENVREVVCDILIHLYNKGWNHLVSTNLSCNRESFTFIFVKRRPLDLRNLGYMSISSHSKLLFVNLKEGTFTKAFEAAKTIIPDVDSWNSDTSSNSFELDIPGSPWSSKSYHHIEVRIALVHIMAIILASHDFICTMNVKRTQDTFLFLQKQTVDERVKESDFFLVTLRKTKKLQVYTTSDEVKYQLNQLVTETMERLRVQIERTIEHMDGKVEYMFKFPPSADGVRTYIIKFLVCKLLEGMRAYGWNVLTGFDMCRSISSKTEILFQRCAHLANCKVFCLSPVMDEGIALINAPDNIVKVCRDAIKAHWHLPLISVTHYDSVLPYHELNIMGSPWSASKPDAFHAHALLCHMIHKFGEKDYKFVMSADVLQDHIELDGGKSMKHDPNSFWFIQEPEFSLDYGEADRALSTSLSDTGSPTYLPSVGSLLRDDFKDPPCLDLSAHKGEISSNSPLVYEPPKARRFDSAVSDNNDGIPSSHGGVGSESVGVFAFDGGVAMQDDFEMPPPSYDQFMREEALNKDIGHCREKDRRK